MKVALMLSVVVIAVHHQHHRQHYPVHWFRQALCIHRNEGYWHDKRNPSYRGGFQFSYTLWKYTIRRHVQLRILHLPSDPANARVRDQILVAWYRYHDESSPWSDWLPYDRAYYCLSL